MPSIFVKGSQDFWLDSFICLQKGSDEPLNSIKNSAREELRSVRLLISRHLLGPRISFTVTSGLLINDVLGSAAISSLLEVLRKANFRKCEWMT
jgi:hypothetical protein